MDIIVLGMIYMEKILNKFFDVLISFGSRLVAAFIIYLAGRFIISKIKKWLKTSPGLSKLDPGVRGFTTSFANVIMNIVLAITIAVTLGIPTTSFITALASCGVAIGLALQGSLSNFAGGIMLLIFKPFKVGDYITTPDASGTVKSITMVYTFLTTPDNKVVTIPNGTLMNSVVENSSASDDRRVDILFNLNSDNDVEKVKSLLLESAAKHSLVYDEPAPYARLSGQSANALEFTLRVWCKNEHYWDVKTDLLETTKSLFKENNIQIPSSQLEVHIKDRK